jgi:hypothetical protein
VGALRADELQPFASAILLRAVDPAAADDALQLLTRRLRSLKTARRGREVRLVRSGITGLPTSPLDLEVDAFALEIRRTAGWAVEGAPFTDVENELCLVVRRGSLFAVHCSGSLGDSLQTWLDRAENGLFRRLPPGLLHALLLDGEAKALWLRGTHAPSVSKADTKTISGLRLQDALSWDDSTFSLGSALSKLPIAPEVSALSGVVGTTPRRALVWLRATSSFQEFREIILELLDTMQRGLDDGRGLDRPFRYLVAEQPDLARRGPPVRRVDVQPRRRRARRIRRGRGLRPA